RHRSHIRQSQFARAGHTFVWLLPAGSPPAWVMTIAIRRPTFRTRQVPLFRICPPGYARGTLSRDPYARSAGILLPCREAPPELARSPMLRRRSPRLKANVRTFRLSPFRARSSAVFPSETGRSRNYRGWSAESCGIGPSLRLPDSENLPPESDRR